MSSPTLLSLQKLSSTKIAARQVMHVLVTIDTPRLFRFTDSRDMSHVYNGISGYDLSRNLDSIWIQFTYICVHTWIRSGLFFDVGLKLDWIWTRSGPHRKTSPGKRTKISPFLYLNAHRFSPFGTIVQWRFLHFQPYLEKYTSYAIYSNTVRFQIWFEVGLYQN